MSLDPFTGIYFTIGETTQLLPDFSTETKVTERIYKIKLVNPFLYAIEMTDITDGFTLSFLAYKANNQLYSGSFGDGIDQYIYENGELVNYYSAKQGELVINGRYVLSRQY